MANTKKTAKKEEVVNTVSEYVVNLKKIKVAFTAIVVVASILLTVFVSGVATYLGIIEKKVSFSFCFQKMLLDLGLRLLIQI